MASLDNKMGKKTPTTTTEKNPKHDDCRAYILSYYREQNLIFLDTGTESNEIRVLVKGDSSFL